MEGREQLFSSIKMAGKWRVMVTGASGLLGRAVVKKLAKDESLQIVGCAHSRCKGNLRKIDLMDMEATEQVVREFQPNVLIHSAGERRPDIVEKDEAKAKQINVDSTAKLAQVMTSLNEGIEKPQHFMLYISTDYVFDGTSPPYKPRDKPNPLNKYGNSKLEGERMLLSHHPMGGILRIPILYGEVEYLRESAVTCLFENLKNTDKPLQMSDYEIRHPTSVDDIATVCYHIAKRWQNDHSFHGVWHWSSVEPMTKYQMVMQMASLFSLPSDHVIPVKEPMPGARRPYNSALDSSDLQEILPNNGTDIATSFKDGIKRCLEPFA